MDKAKPDEAERLDLRVIQKLVRIMNRAELAEIEIDDSRNGLRVHLRRGGREDGPPAAVQPVVHVLPGAGAAPAAAPAPGGGARPAEGAGDTPPGTTSFPSPMVGTFYRSSSPESEPFVEVGSRITEDSVVCIIEAMKVMNEIKAELRGEIVEILVDNGDPVEFGQPLFLIKKT